MTNSRAKGAAGERELANILKDYGFEARRGQQYCGANGDPDVVGIPGIHIECKRCEQYRIDKWMHQAAEDAKDGEIPVVIFRANKTPWKVTMDLEHFIYLIKKINE